MVALPSVPGVVRFSVRGTTPVANWVNALYWSYTGAAPSAAACTSFAESLFTAWTTHMAPLMLTAATLEETTCTDLASALGNTGANVGHQVGSAGVVEVPGSSAVLIKKTVGRRYRGGHPRSYILAGIQTDLADCSHWSGALVAAVTSAYQNVQAAINGLIQGGTTLGVEVCVSYVDKVINPVPPNRRPVPLVLPVTHVAAEPAIATQRRRLGR